MVINCKVRGSHRGRLELDVVGNMNADDVNHPLPVPSTGHISSLQMPHVKATNT